MTEDHKVCTCVDLMLLLQNFWAAVKDAERTHTGILRERKADGKRKASVN